MGAHKKVRGDFLSMCINRLVQHRHKFDVLPTCWPYEPGYGLRCKKCRMILETGITKELAEQIAAEENAK